MMQMTKLAEDTAEAVQGNFEEVFSTFVEEPRRTINKNDVASNEELLGRDRHSLKLLERAISHINDYDSLETAAKLISQAREFTSSYQVKEDLVKARKNLQSAHRIMRPRFKPHYTAMQKKQTKHNSINNALELIANAMVALKVEEDKRTGSLFDNLTSRATVDLPLRVKNPKAKFLIREAPVVISAAAGQPMNVKFTRLETKLYLVHNATFIGVCVNNISGQLGSKSHTEHVAAFARDKALEKLGASVHTEPTYRPSDGIQWFLVMNFNIGITYAAFPDYVRATYATVPMNENFSYEDYVKGMIAKEAVEQAMKAQRLRGIREAFEDKNRGIYDTIKNNERLIAFKLDQIEHLKNSFLRLTSLEDGESDGLKTNQYDIRFDRRFTQIALDNYLDSTLPFVALRDDIRKQRIQAREVFYTIKMLLEDINDLRKTNKVIVEQINNLKRQEAIKHGMYGRAPVAEIEAA